MVGILLNNFGFCYNLSRKEIEEIKKYAVRARPYNNDGSVSQRESWVLEKSVAERLGQEHPEWKLMYENFYVHAFKKFKQ